MQASRLIVAFQIISYTILVGCKINTPTEEGLNPDILQAKELIYTNHLVEAEQEILIIDTAVLDDNNKGAYYLASAFLYHEIGNRTLALSSMSKASELILSSDNDFLKAEFSLINGFIFEQLILRSEALKSYFQAFEYYGGKAYTDKLFYTLLGIARTAQGGSEYLKLAEELLGELKSNRFHVLYLNAQAALISDIRERNRIILKSLDYFDEQHALKKQNSIYSGIALNYQLLDQSDSSNYYLSIAQEIIEDHKLPPEQNFHFYIIKAYIEASNQQYDQALETLVVLFNHASNEPGILSQAFLRRSLIMKNQGKFEEAYYDLKKYTRLEAEENAKGDKYQLGLLSIQYQVQQKELSVAQLKIKLLIISVMAVLVLTILSITLFFNKRRAIEKRKEIENKLDVTGKRFQNLVKQSIDHADSINRSPGMGPVFEQIKNRSEFDIYFDIKFPLFKEKMQQQYPELSTSDLKYCACILSGLTLFQTSKILGVSTGAVKKARIRIRKKLDCHSLKSLTRRLQQIDFDPTKK